MDMLVAQPAAAVTIKEDYCSRCSICSSLCPFQAISKAPETDKIVLDIAKCQVCGLCYSTCPAAAISSVYYDLDSLSTFLTTAKETYGADSLAIMCKGSTPDVGGVKKLLGTAKFVPLSVPCVGRMPEEVYLRALSVGIKKIRVLACDEDYCRFDRGSTVAGRKIMALNRLFRQLGYGEAISLKRNSLKVRVDKDKCITCGNCVFYCPYHAAKIEDGSASFNLELCRGCGLCVSLCPAFALELENWEKARISSQIAELSSQVEKPGLLIFHCQWAVLPPFAGGFGPHVAAIELPCAARVDILHILEAFQNGVQGVLVAACPEEDCKQEKKGSKEAQHQVTLLKERLGKIGLGDRLHFCFVAPRYPETFIAELQKFSQGIGVYVPKGEDR
jgi:coenzyme F420-reducing hydrogenase delta subunit